MIETLLTSIRNWMLNLNWNRAKKKVFDTADQKELERIIEDYISRCSDQFQSFSLDEEFDFCGLVEFFQSNLSREVDKYLYAGNHHIRKRARKDVIKKALSYAQANKEGSIEKVKKFTENLLDIIIRFKEEKADSNLQLMANKVIDELSDKTTADNIQVMQGIDSIKEMLQNEEPIRAAIKRDDILTAEKELARLKNEISSEHKLFPYYGYTYSSNGQLLSIPLSSEAEKKHPPYLNLRGKLMIDGHEVSEYSDEIFNHAYRNQKDISFIVEDATKFLGEVEDPIQHEAEALIGVNLIHHPKPFPPAFPISVSCNDEVIFNYILIRIESILDDGTYILSNYEQENRPFQFTLSMNFQTKQTSYNFSIIEYSAKVLLKLYKIMKSSGSDSVIAIRSLRDDQVFLEGKITTSTNNCSANELEENMIFFENVIAIENYFSTQIPIQQSYTQIDYNSIQYFGTLIRGESITYHWNKVETHVTKSSLIKPNILRLENKPHNLVYITTASMSLLGKIYELPISMELKNYYIANFDDMIKNFDVLEDGDSLKVEIVTDDEKGICVHRLHKKEAASQPSVPYH